MSLKHKIVSYWYSSLEAYLLAEKLLDCQANIFKTCFIFIFSRDFIGLIKKICWKSYKKKKFFMKNSVWDMEDTKTLVVFVSVVFQLCFFCFKQDFYTSSLCFTFFILLLYYYIFIILYIMRWQWICCHFLKIVLLFLDSTIMKNYYPIKNLLNGVQQIF